MHRVLNASGQAFQTLEFSPYGYDERQFCSPAFDLPIGRLSRAVHGEFPEYHSSADNLDFVSEASLEASLTVLEQFVDATEQEETYINLKPECEPQLGRRGLFKAIGGQAETKDYQMALLWMLNLSDGNWSVEDIAERSGLDVAFLKRASDRFLETDLFEHANGTGCRTSPAPR